jgi:hypothetical protein
MIAGRWLSGVFGVVLVIMLITGRTFNPLRGMSPLIVARADRPGLYWTGIAFWGFLLAVMVWIGFLKAAP